MKDIINIIRKQIPVRLKNALTSAVITANNKKVLLDLKRRESLVFSRLGREVFQMLINGELQMSPKLEKPFEVLKKIHEEFSNINVDPLSHRYPKKPRKKTKTNLG